MLRSHFSSGEVCGQLEDGVTVSENKYGHLDPTNIRSYYGESKRMGENLCISYGHQYNIPIKIVRPFHIYGPGMKFDDGRVFADFVKNIVNNQDIEMKSDGRAMRSFCYLVDATVVFIAVLLYEEIGHAYNVGNSNNMISIKDLARILSRLQKALKQMNF